MSMGGAEHPLRVAIIGSGPSGFYAAEHLLSHDDLNVQVEMFDRLPTPFGLVRAGVAPDHPKIKSVTRVFDKVATNPEFRFRGNVEFGRNIEHEDLLEYFNAVIYCVGARSDRRLGIAREYLPGSHGASDFVGWYNASPDQRNLTFDFSGERVVVVGNGNVAMDVARVLMLPPEELAATDIGGHALRALSANKVREVTILGRRGPAQAAFTYRELRELAERDDIDVIVDPADMQLDPHSLHDTSHSADRGRDQVLDLLRELSERGDRGHDRRIVFRFLVSPVEIVGTNRVEGVDVVHNDLYRGNNGELRARATDRHEIVPADIVFRAIGYQGVALPGVPFDPITSTIPNDRGRVIDSLTGQPREGEYVAGWIKRGPNGIIGTNKPDAQETVEMLVEDLRAGRMRKEVLSPEVFNRFLSQRQGEVVSFDDWKFLDSREVAKGEELGRPRLKFARVENMLRVLRHRDRN
ncbi:MAG: FAD-dependent oxidoreductase [Actinobacteria bacterium]|nr:FAD-dependent oxidoreductase [Actinomycetota bacterium]